MGKFIKKTFVTVYSFLLVCLLTAGIYYADLNTRSIGFEDAKPVFYCDINGQQIYLHFMGSELNIDADDSSFINAFVNDNKKTVPLRTKFIKALSDFIKKITGLFLRAVGQ